MGATLRQALRLVDRSTYRRWAMLITLAVAVSGLEVVAAFAMLIVLRAATDRSAALDLPVIGDLRTEFPGVADNTLIVWVLGCVGLVFLVKAGAVVTQTYLQNRLAQEAGVRLSDRLLRGYLAMPYTFHTMRRSPDLIRNATESVVSIVDYMFVPVVLVVSESMLVLAVVTVLLVTAPLATLAAVLVLAPLVFGMLRVLQPRLARIGEVYQDVYSENLQVLQQSLHGIRDVKVSGSAGRFEARFTAHRRVQARLKYVRATLIELPRVLIELVLVLGILTFLAVTLARSTSADESLAVLGLFGYAVIRVLPSTNRIIGHLNTMRFAAAAVSAVSDDLTEVERRAPAGALPPPLEFRQAVDFDRVSYRYPGGDSDALHGVTVSIRRGESVGIVGPTGSGKTTFVDLLLGLLTPTAGHVRVDGVDLAGKETAWLRNLGVVSQAFFLFDETLRRNIALGEDDDDIDDERVHEAVDLAQLTTFVESLPAGLDTRVGEHGVRLSGGQRQRVAIARALYRRPEVLVFDEGTSALDNETEAALMESLDALRGTRTVVLVAHRLTTVRNCDRVLLIRNGVLEQAGSYDEVIRMPEAVEEASGAGA